MNVRNKTWAAQEEVEDWDWEEELYMHERLVHKLVSKTNAVERKWDKRKQNKKKNTATKGLIWLERVGEMTPQQATEEWMHQQTCYDVVRRNK
jgi:hypothetical protein